MLHSLQAREIIEALILVRQPLGQIGILDAETRNAHLLRKEIAGLDLEAQLQESLGKGATPGGCLQDLSPGPAREDPGCLSMSLVTGIDRQPVVCRRRRRDG
jgi:hypothetical protein